MAVFVSFIITITVQYFYFRDFKSSRYSTYNNLLQLKSVHRFNQVVEIKSSFDYGRTYTSKVNKQRAIVNGIAKYSFKKNGASINYNVSIGYQPAVSNHIYYSKLKKWLKISGSALIDSNVQKDWDHILQYLISIIYLHLLIV